jgi:hypothetical protein
MPRCDLDDTLIASLYCRKYELRLSVESAGVLLRQKIIDETDLIAYSEYLIAILHSPVMAEGKGLKSTKPVVTTLIHFVV